MSACLQVHGEFLLQCTNNARAPGSGLQRWRRRNDSWAIRPPDELARVLNREVKTLEI